MLQYEHAFARILAVVDLAIGCRLNAFSNTPTHKAGDATLIRTNWNASAAKQFLYAK